MQDKNAIEQAQEHLERAQHTRLMETQMLRAVIVDLLMILAALCTTHGVPLPENAVQRANDVLIWTEPKKTDFE